MFAKEEGVPVDRAALAERISQAVAEVVKKPVASDIDLVSDGEMSFVYQDLAEFPNIAERVFSDPGRSRRRTPACTGPIGVGDPPAPLADIDNLKAALTGVDAAGAFLGAASPGVISLFFRSDHYANQAAYLFAIAEAMRGEYEAVAAAGITLQIDTGVSSTKTPRRSIGRNGRHSTFADAWP